MCHECLVLHAVTDAFRSKLVLNMRTLLWMVLLLGVSFSLAHNKVWFEDGGIPFNPLAAPIHQDDIVFDVVSAKPKVALRLSGRGSRLMTGATTDIWVHGRYAYLGTFNRPCGTGEAGNAGVQVFDTQNPYSVDPVATLPSVRGSRVNDVKVARMHQRDILVHSNERCSGDGIGGFEIYDVTNPLVPLHLAHVTTPSVNKKLASQGESDNGVHNLYLFSRDGHDYVAAQVYTIIGDFQIYDITNPNNIYLAGYFGAEQLEWSGVDWVNTRDATLIANVTSYKNSGYGMSTNRYLHDHYVTPDGQTAYLANWDAGLIRLDISDISEPRVVSVAIDIHSEDGEVNSHSVWPNETGTIVLEGEEDFDPFSSQFRILTGSNKGHYSSIEGNLTTPVALRKSGQLMGQTVYVGDACDEIPVAESKVQVALIARGDCSFEFKLTMARQSGYAGAVVFNDALNADNLVSMGGDGFVNTSAVFVSHDTGLKIAGVTNAKNLRVGHKGEMIRVATEASGWGGVRIWDYSDPAHPVLASTFNTLCSAYPDKPECDDRGTYSSHNVIVEGERAYISWYSDGVIVLDISDPYAPVELARYARSGEAFERLNDGIQDVWGIYKTPDDPRIFASDRNGGLYIIEDVAH